MAERIQTGGLKIFDYRKSEKKNLTEEQKREIQEAYSKYDERKKREKTRRFILILLAIILLVAGILAFIIFK